jgi:hypothetical protein
MRQRNKSALKDTLLKLEQILFKTHALIARPISKVRFLTQLPSATPRIRRTFSRAGKSHKKSNISCMPRG